MGYTMSLGQDDFGYQIERKTPSFRSWSSQGYFFLGPKIKKYKEFNNQKQTENLTND